MTFIRGYVNYVSSCILTFIGIKSRRFQSLREGTLGGDVQQPYFVRPGPLLVNKGGCRGCLIKVNLTFDSDSLLISCIEY
jgi:hypothetical protein